MRSRARTPAPTRALPALLLAGLLLVGCGAAPPTIGATGVDGLQVPTASPDPSDYSATVDNPWLPLEPGTVREYDAGAGRTLTRTVGEQSVRVAGVDTTEVVSVLHGRAGRPVRTQRAWYAQDRSGNVWLFGMRGPDGAWRAGEDGALAGLAMPAVPRRGDGFVDGEAPGVHEDRLEVVEVGADPPVGVDADGPLLLLRRRSPLEPGAETEEYYGEGTGLVATDPVGTDDPGLLLEDRRS